MSHLRSLGRITDQTVYPLDYKYDSYEDRNLRCRLFFILFDLLLHRNFTKIWKLIKYAKHVCNDSYQTVEQFS